MSMNDLLSDSLTRIRNGQIAKKKSVLVLKSKLTAAVLKVLCDQGYIKGFFDSVDAVFPSIEVDLAYYDGAPVIKLIKRISKPGRRVYSSIGDLPKSHNGLGIKVLSTPKGILADCDARTLRVGGEVLCEVF
jgi:small subunit ribosomal protein S8